jgi:hypothetical protein
VLRPGENRAIEEQNPGAGGYNLDMLTAQAWLRLSVALLIAVGGLHLCCVTTVVAVGGDSEVRGCCAKEHSPTPTPTAPSPQPCHHQDHCNLCPGITGWVAPAASRVTASQPTAIIAPPSALVIAPAALTHGLIRFDPHVHSPPSTLVALHCQLTR